MINWPSDLVTFVSDSWFLQGSSVSSGRGLDGREQVVFRENRYWIGALTTNPVHRQKIPPFLAKVDEIRGRSQVFRLPVCNIYAPKYGGDDAAFYTLFGYTPTEIANGQQEFSDGTTFSDDTGFALPPNTASTTTADAPAGAGAIAVGGIASLLQAGTYFSIDDFLYRVAASGTGLLSFHPPLRQDVPAGSVVETNTPTIAVRMSDDNDARLFVEHHRWSRPVSFNVVEAFQR